MVDAQLTLMVDVQLSLYNLLRCYFYLLINDVHRYLRLLILDVCRYLSFIARRFMINDAPLTLMVDAQLTLMVDALLSLITCCATIYDC